MMRIPSQRGIEEGKRSRRPILELDLTAPAPTCVGVSDGGINEVGGPPPPPAGDSLRRRWKPRARGSQLGGIEQPPRALASAVTRKWIGRVAVKEEHIVDVTKILIELKQERERLDDVIQSLVRLARSHRKQRGRPPAWLAVEERRRVYRAERTRLQLRKPRPAPKQRWSALRISADAGCARRVAT